MELFPQHTEINILPTCLILRMQSTEKRLGDLSNRITLRWFKEKLQAKIPNDQFEIFITQGAFEFLYKKLRQSLQQVLLPVSLLVALSEGRARVKFESGSNFYFSLFLPSSYVF